MLSSIDQIDRERVLTHALQEIRDSAWEGSLVIRDFLEEMDMDNDEGFLIRKHPELEPAFESFIRSKAEETFDNGLREISSMVSDSGHIQVWRALVVDRDWMTQGMDDKPIGQSWSFHKHSAKPYCGEGWSENTIDVRIEAFVSADDVDWEQTMLLYTAAAYTVGEENEIFLLPSAKVDIVSAKQTHSADPLEMEFDRGTKTLVAGTDAADALLSAAP